MHREVLASASSPPGRRPGADASVAVDVARELFARSRGTSRANRRTWMFSLSMAISCVDGVGDGPPAGPRELESAATSPGRVSPKASCAAIRSASFSAKTRKSSVRATKSVSQFDLEEDAALA